MEFVNGFERTKGGAEITRGRREEAGKETGGGAAGFLYEDDSADDELSKLMPSLKRQLEAFDDDEGTLNFMGEIVMAKMERFRHTDKENIVSDGDSIRHARRRRGSGQVTISRPIDFSKLLASNKTEIPGPSSSPYENMTPILKENVNRTGNQCQIVDDFWSTQRKKKMSAVARRRLSRIKTPAQTKLTAVEDRNVRHARSRRGGGNSRAFGRRPIKLDLRLDAAKISEWDQETLAEEEEVPPSNRPYSGAVLIPGHDSRPAAHVNEEVPPSTRAHSGAMSAGTPAADVEEEVPPSTRAYFMSAGRAAADSPSSLPDMEMSPCQSRLVEMPELSGRVERDQTPLEDPGSSHAGFPVPASNRQTQRFPLTSPTPPSNPVAAYMSSRNYLESEDCHRRLSFLSSPTSESIDTGGSREGAIRILGQEENALLTVSHDHCEGNEDLDVLDVEEAALRHKYNGSGLGEQTLQNGLQQNQEVDSGAAHEGETKPKVDHTGHLPSDAAESLGEVPIGNEAQVLPDELREAGDSEAAPPCVDEHQNNPPTERFIETDEGSTTQTKPKRVKRLIKKAENRRSSLEGCGSIWKEGHRRSQRIKVRPLEWWRGEKLLYSRIHSTLMTLVGVKFSSPGKYARGIDEPFTVESYVQPQYSELVRFAAI